MPRSKIADAARKREEREAEVRAQKKIALQFEVMPGAKVRDCSSRIAQAAAKQAAQAEVIPLKSGERKRLKREVERHQQAYQPRDQEQTARILETII